MAEDKKLVSCPSCGTENPANAKFCQGCGGSINVKDTVKKTRRKADKPKRKFLDGKRNMIGNVVIVLSIIVVIICIMNVASIEHDATYNTQSVDWNGLHFILIEGLVVESQTNDTITFKSNYEKHNIQVRMTDDYTEYNERVGHLDKSERLNGGVVRIPFNSSHYLIKRQDSQGVYEVLVPYESLPKLNGSDNPYEIQGNPTIIEFKGQDPEFIQSFIKSMTAVI